MKLKYFSKTYMTDEAIRWLKRSRKEIVYGKLVEFENGILELYDFEKPILVKKQNDSLLQEIETLKEGLYDFDKLSSSLKKYMREKDNLFFNKAYREYVRSKEIDNVVRGEIIALESLNVNPEEFMNFWNGRKKLHTTPEWKKLKDSTRRTYKTVNDLIRANLTKFDVFVTLTFARKENAEKYNYDFEYVDNLKDLKEVTNSFVRFIDNLRKKIKRNGKELYYITVYERHKDGNYHFHMLMNDIGEEYLVNAPEFLDYDYKTKSRRRGLMLKDWKYGKSDYDKILDQERMASYLCKYLTKTMLNLSENDRDVKNLLNAKRYFPSRNLQRPIVSYRNDIPRLIDEKKIEYADTYSTEYHNYYNKGTIKKVIYSKPDLHNYTKKYFKRIPEKKSLQPTI